MNRRHLLKTSLAASGALLPLSPRLHAQDARRPSMIQPIFNVKRFGAVGNGIANDTRPIGDAITTAGKAGRGTVFFPAGTYSVTQAADNVPCLELKSNIDYRGVGRSSELVLAPGSFHSTRLMSTLTDNAQNIRILDLHLNANRRSQDRAA